MLALCLMFLETYYAQDYVGIKGLGLVMSVIMRMCSKEHSRNPQKVDWQVILKSKIVFVTSSKFACLVNLYSYIWLTATIPSIAQNIQTPEWITKSKIIHLPYYLRGDGIGLAHLQSASTRCFKITFHNGPYAKL